MITVPKHEIRLMSGQPVPPEVKEILLRFFPKKQVDKLGRLGGRIQFSIAAPGPKRLDPTMKGLFIDESFVGELIAQRSNSEKMRAVLNGMSVRQLKEVCGMLGQPLRSKATKAEIIAEIVTNIGNEDFWRQIASRPSEKLDV
jgi:hypothetical protein